MRGDLFQRAAPLASLALLLGCGAGDSAPETEQAPLPSAALDTGLVEQPEDTPSGELCDEVQAPVRLRPGPVDIVVVLDNSGSMSEELSGVEANINDNFASVLEQRSVDYRVILLSEHRTPSATGNEVDSTAVCISQPLSSIEQCPSAQPGPTERFFHYSTKIGSNDALHRILSSYAAPDGAYGLTDAGWSVWLREGAKKVFLVVSDDDAAMPATTFIEQLTNLAPQQFGGSTSPPSFVFHSVIGLREKANPSDAYYPHEPRTALRCRSDSARVISPGLEYQNLSRRTGGLRFPLCKLELYDTLLRFIAGDVLSRSRVDCSFDIPPPPRDQVVELDNVEVVYQLPGTSEPITLRQARTPADCGADAFQITDGQVQLCAESCAAVNGDGLEEPNVAVRFTCQPSFVLR